MLNNAGTLTIDEKTSETLDRYMANHYKRLPINFTSADGVWLYAGQRKVLDLMAQYSAAGFGRGSMDGSPFFREVVGAIADELVNGCGVLPGSCANETVATGAKTLCEFTRMDKVVFMNTGAEAFDTAVKIIRKYLYINSGITEERGTIIVCDNNFHGRTLGAISASDTKQYKEGFGPLLPGFGWIRFGDTDCLETAIKNASVIWGRHAIAFLVEPVQGEGGINVPPDGYLREARRICHKYGMLFVLDEVQTGFGRTGDTFAWERDGHEAEPDLMMLGKLLGGGIFPVSAVIGRGGIMSVFRPNDHGSTFGGTPLACRAVTEVVRIFQENPDLVANARETGEYFATKLKEIVDKIKSPLIDDVRGRGLLLGIKFKSSLAEYFQAQLLDKNILAGVAGHGHVLRFSPPLIITKKEIDWALPRIEKVLLNSQP